MAEGFDVEACWPELFAQLDAAQRRAVVQSLAADWHEGWVPNREDVENLTDEARGAIDREEYMRRVREAAERHRKVGAAASPEDALRCGRTDLFGHRSLPECVDSRLTIAES